MVHNALNAWCWDSGRLRYSSSEGIEVTLQALGPQGAPEECPQLPEMLPGASRFVLWEWTRYKLRVSPANACVAVLCGDRRAESLGEGLYLFSYENSLGAGRITFDRAPIAPLDVEVLSRKLPNPLLYRAMVKEVLSALLTLPFDLTGSTAHGTEPADSAAGPFFLLHFLRRHGDEVAEALRTIAHAPHRVLTREERITPVARIRRLDSAAVRWGVTHPACWVETADAGTAWFDSAGRNYLVDRLLQERAEETLDTVENRFVKYFLTLLTAGARDAIGLALDLRLANDRLVGQLQENSEQLEEAAGWPWWAEVGELSYLPGASQVLHRKDGYRELFQLYPEFLLARTVFGAGLEKAIAARNVATLYEYWCFLRLADTLQRFLGAAQLKAEPDPAGGLARGVAVSFADSDHRLIFNRSFPGRSGSYSVGLRPDFTIVDSHHRPVVVFDAKFRLEIPATDLDDPGAIDRLPQMADIYKMHTYRDALQVRAAVALYPGNRALFYHQDGRRSQPSIEDVVRNGVVSGVGSIPLSPGEGTA